MKLATYLGILSAGLLAYLVHLALKAGPWPWPIPHGNSKKNVPVSVNYHFTRRCNKTCGFCFHTATTSHKEEPARAKHGLGLLRAAGMRKINFAGGEPFLYPKFLADMLDYCKQTLRLESVSIVTNGSLVREEFLRRNARNIDILAVSCDSFDEATNIEIGRGSGDQVSKLYQIAEWCARYKIRFKLNTVVCRLNYLEDMNVHLSRLQPFRWKCFQVLIVAGENDHLASSSSSSSSSSSPSSPSSSTPAPLRDGTKFTISDEEFAAFCHRHAAQPSLVPEPNRLMAKSYLILDEYLRFLDRTGKQPSRPIVEVGVQEALASIFWDEDAFLERGGLYDWTKEEEGCGGGGESLEW